VLGNNQASMCLEIKYRFMCAWKNQVYLCLEKSGLSVLGKIRFICAWKNQVYLCLEKSSLYVLGKNREQISKEGL